MYYPRLIDEKLPQIIFEVITINCVFIFTPFLYLVSVKTSMYLYINCITHNRVVYSIKPSQMICS